MGLMVSEKKIFEGSLAILAPYKHMTPWGIANLDPQGFDWQDLCRGPLNIAIY